MPTPMAIILACERYHAGCFGTMANACLHTAHLLLRCVWGRLLLLLLLLRGGGDPGRQLLEVGRVHSRPGWRRRRQLHGTRALLTTDTVSRTA